MSNSLIKLQSKNLNLDFLIQGVQSGACWRPIQFWSYKQTFCQFKPLFKSLFLHAVFNSFKAISADSRLNYSYVSPSRWGDISSFTPHFLLASRSCRAKDS